MEEDTLWLRLRPAFSLQDSWKSKVSMTYDSYDHDALIESRIKVAVRAKKKI